MPNFYLRPGGCYTSCSATVDVTGGSGSGWLYTSESLPTESSPGTCVYKQTESTAQRNDLHYATNPPQSFYWDVKFSGVTAKVTLWAD